MLKFIMFNEIPETSQIMLPNGEIESVEQVKARYPILKTPLGVIGFTTDDEGTVGELILMGYYDNINSFVDTYKSQGVEITPDMTNSEKCAVITEFVNNPVSEEDEALDAFLSM